VSQAEADVAEHWRTTQVHADTTAAAVAGDLKNHILPAFGDKEIGRIRHSDIQAWVRRLSERLAPTTVDRSYRWLAAIFRLAVNDDLIRRSPCFAIKLPAKRGEIVDRAGHVLAYSVDADTIAADPSDIAHAKNYVAAAIDAVKSGQRVGVPATKAYGCSVKYASGN